MMGFEWAFLWTQILLGAAILLQTVENFLLPKDFLRVGDPGFVFVNGLRLLLGVALLIGVPEPWIPFGLIIIQVLISVRFMGLLNGGSDVMTMQILLALAVRSAAPGSWRVQFFALGWIALQSALSYFLSGARKVKNPEWWKSGAALERFLVQSRVCADPVRRVLLGKPRVLHACSLGVVIFELLCPGILLFRELAPSFLALGVGFHLMVFFCFGLNRFVWAWLASYPALYVLSGVLREHGWLG